MTTTTSYSKGGRFWGLYKSVLQRNLGYFSLLSILIFVFYPLQYAMEAFREIDPATLAVLPDTADALLRIHNFGGLGMNFTAVSGIVFTVLMELAPLVLGLLLQSYMHSKKAVDVYHALPVTRGMLLGVNAAAAMTMIAVPVVVSNLFVSVSQALQFGFDAGRFGLIWLDCLGWLICAAAVYAITVFVSVCAGTVFDTFVFSSVLLLTAPVLSGVFLMLAQTFLYGWSTPENFFYNLFAFSPITLMPMRFAFGRSVFGTPENSPFLYNTVAIFVWLALGAAIFFAAIKLYRVRRSELAEATTSKGILQVLVKLVGTLVCGLLAGMIFYSFNDSSKGQFFLWTFIAGGLTYCIVEVILNRGFKTLLRSLPLGAVMVGLALAGPALLTTGGLGYEQRVPDVADVASLEINYGGRYEQSVNGIYKLSAQPTQDNIYGTLQEDNFRSRIVKNYHTVTLTQPETVGAVLAYHRAAADEKFARRQEELDAAGKKGVWNSYQITYQLKTGRKLIRQYNGTTIDTMTLLAPLETSEEFLEQVHPAFFNRGADVKNWIFHDAYGNKRLEQGFSAADSQALLDAMKADLLAQTTEGLLHASGPVLASIHFECAFPEGAAERATDRGHFLVTAATPQTEAFLTAKGILPELISDPADCYAVLAELNEAGNSRGLSSAVLQIPSSDESFYTSDFSDLKAKLLEAKAYRTEHPEEWPEAPYETVKDRKAMDFSTGVTLFENAADIQALADAAVSSWNHGETMVYASFYFKDATRGTPVLIPYERLPAQVKAQFVAQLSEK